MRTIGIIAAWVRLRLVITKTQVSTSANGGDAPTSW